MSILTQSISVALQEMILYSNGTDFYAEFMEVAEDHTSFIKLILTDLFIKLNRVQKRPWFKD